jgi:hypothetical protein
VRPGRDGDPGGERHRHLGPYEFEIDIAGRAHINGEYVGVMRRTDLPAMDPGGVEGAARGG